MDAGGGSGGIGHDANPMPAGGGGVPSPQGQGIPGPRVPPPNATGGDGVNASDSGGGAGGDRAKAPPQFMFGTINQGILSGGGGVSTALPNTQLIRPTLLSDSLRSYAHCALSPSTAWYVDFCPPLHVPHAADNSVR